MNILPSQILEEDEAPMSPTEERDVWEAMFPPDLSEEEIFALICEQFWPDEKHVPRAVRHRAALGTRKRITRLLR